MYTVYVMVLNQNTPVVGKTYFGAQVGGGGGGGEQFPVLLKGEQKIFIAAYGNRYFISTYVQFQEPPLVVINDTSLSTMTQNQI